MFELYSKAEVDALLQPLQHQLTAQAQEIRLLKEAQSEWVTQDEACRLAGRSRRWFTLQRTNDTLPIAIKPRTSDSGRIFFLRTDCIKYAQQSGFLPPSEA